MTDPDSSSGDSPTNAQPASDGGGSPQGDGDNPDGSIFPRPHMEVVTANEKPPSIKAPHGSGDDS